MKLKSRALLAYEKLFMWQTINGRLPGFRKVHSERENHGRFKALIMLPDGIDKIIATNIAV
jgi:hypothetical protein